MSPDPAAEALSKVHDRLAAIGVGVASLLECHRDLVRELALLRRIEARLFDPNGRLPDKTEFLRRAAEWYESMSEGA